MEAMPSLDVSVERNDKLNVPTAMEIDMLLGVFTYGVAEDHDVSGR